MEEQEELINNNNNNKKLPTLPSPFIFFTKLISLQVDILSTTIYSFASPFLSILSLLSFPFRQQPHSKDEDVVVVSDTPRGGGVLLGRILAGLVAAAYVCVVLMVVLVVSAVVGVGVVRLWYEEPVYVRESLLFDYTDAHPTALFSFGERKGGGGYYSGVPVGQTLYVSLLLLMPESDYNRELGIFQLSAEIISSRGDVIAKSSHPQMLRFRSWPIRLARTFAMGVPLLLGITAETQTIALPILKHKEVGHPRTEAVRITLIPRAGTSSLPQFYDAEILVKSQLPWTKALVYRWKWTLYVWTTMYTFMMLVMFLVTFLKPLILPVITTSLARREEDSTVESVSREPLTKEREVSESLRRLQRSRNKRKAALLHGGAMPEPVDSSASSITVSRGEICGSSAEGSGDSESVCFGG